HRALHPFPTRRSSDLVRRRRVLGAEGEVIEVGQPGRRWHGMAFEGLGQAVRERSARFKHQLVAAGTAEMEVAVQVVRTFMGPQRSEEHTSELQSRENL